MSTAALGREEGGEELYISIPLGGPVYVPDGVGPLIGVGDLEASMFQELQSLTETLSLDSEEGFDEDISVDELKIIREDELVKKAFEEAFKDGVLTMEALGTSDSSNGKSLKTCMSIDKESKKKPQVNPLKRKRKNKKNNDFDERYLVKVEQLSRIKQTQEEDKAAVRLHSFDGSKERKHDANSKADNARSLKYGSVSTKVRASNASDNTTVHFPETVLSVEVYRNKKPLFKTQEFLVLGQQFLSEVKDNIYCLTDKIMKRVGQHDPSGYFLIEDIFCNDTRESSAIDYSKPILDWLEDSKADALEKWEHIVSGELQPKQKEILGSESKQKLPRFKSAHMQSTRFCDLRFRLGAGYLYCHQGDCRHIIVIRDMRLIHAEDVQTRGSYPLVTIQSKLRYKKCMVCKIYRAQKMTVDDKWALFNPCYFCDVCYYMLHYADGSLLYNDFKVYDYCGE